MNDQKFIQVYINALCQNKSNIYDVKFSDYFNLTSNIKHHFEIQNFRQLVDCSNGKPNYKINFLTLAGLDGPLPQWVSEKIQIEHLEGGKVLHRFLDIINRRFWDFYFLLQTAGHRENLTIYNKSSTQKIVNLYENIWLSKKNTNFNLNNVLHDKFAIEILQKKEGLNFEEILSLFFKVKVNKKTNLLRLPIEKNQRTILGNRINRLKHNVMLIGEKSQVLGNGNYMVDFNGHASSIKIEYLKKIKPSIIEISKIIANDQSIRINIQQKWSKEYSMLGNSSCQLGIGMKLMRSQMPASKESIHFNFFSI
jgi:hypothetical protein